ncbi:MAG TPA: MBL fold metallo-hydrolase [Candidatus Acidoferrum sp.]|nr:MBL fold metallo-hydrolase [Candidatus Acidoferrum sp.]
MTLIRLEPVDAVEITIVMDLYLDILMASGPGVQRFKLAYDWSDRDSLLAEHGFSALIRVEANGHRDAVLYDAGLSPKAVRNNLDVMQIDARDLRALVISHGHADHHGGLEGLYQRFGRLHMPLVLHPDAWRERKIALPSGVELHMPPPSRNDLDREGLEVVEERGPSLLIDGKVLVSGQVDRTTDFEKGFPWQLARASDSRWEPDPWIWDDQNVIVNVRGRGLVVVSACSHSGAVNVLKNARRLTGEQTIAGFIGGFHLTGGLLEPIIPATVGEIMELGVARLVPAHCTGWRATHELARAMPDAFVQPSVGTVFRFAAN